MKNRNNRATKYDMNKYCKQKRHKYKTLQTEKAEI